MGIKSQILVGKELRREDDRWEASSASRGTMLHPAAPTLPDFGGPFGDFYRCICGLHRLQSHVMLTTKQKTILDLMRRGLRNAEIASALKMKERTVKYHVSRLFLQFDVTNRTELVGLLDEPAPFHAESSSYDQRGPGIRSRA